MNNKIKSLKKSLFSACNKLVISNNKQTSFEEVSQESTKKRKLSVRVVNHQKSQAKKTTQSRSLSRSMSAESLEQLKCDNVNLGFASSSSGYGTTSVKSTLSIFVNLDNYFYDENFAKVNILLNILQIFTISFRRLD